MLTDGKPDTSCSLILKEIERLRKKQDTKIHTISFSCTDRYMILCKSNKKIFEITSLFIIRRLCYQNVPHAQVAEHQGWARHWCVPMRTGRAVLAQGIARWPTFPTAHVLERLVFTPREAISSLVCSTELIPVVLSLVTYASLQRHKKLIHWPGLESALGRC